MRLKIRQATPNSLQYALVDTFELASFQMASQQRSRLPRGLSWKARRVSGTTGQDHDESLSVNRLEGMTDRLLAELSRKPRKKGRG